MKALNNKEILRKYVIFLAYFSMLIFYSVVCIFLYMKTSNAYASAMEKKKDQLSHVEIKRMEITEKIDSLNNYLHLLYTGQVNNDAALESKILKYKYQVLEDIKKYNDKGNGYLNLHKKILNNIEQLMDAKKHLQKVKGEEAEIKEKLLDCNKANKKLYKR